MVYYPDVIQILIDLSDIDWDLYWAWFIVNNPL